MSLSRQLLQLAQKIEKKKAMDPTSNTLEDKDYQEVGISLDDAKSFFEQCLFALLCYAINPINSCNKNQLVLLCIAFELNPAKILGGREKFHIVREFLQLYKENKAVPAAARQTMKPPVDRKDTPSTQDVVIGFFALQQKFDANQLTSEEEKAQAKKFMEENLFSLIQNTGTMLVENHRKIKFLCRYLKINPVPILLNAEKPLEKLISDGAQDIPEGSDQPNPAQNPIIKFLIEHFNNEMMQFVQKHRKKVLAALVKHPLYHEQYPSDPSDIFVTRRDPHINEYLKFVLTQFRVDLFEFLKETNPIFSTLSEHFTLEGVFRGKVLNDIYRERIRLILEFVEKNKPREFHEDFINGIKYRLSSNNLKTVLDELKKIRATKEEPEERTSLFKPYRELMEKVLSYYNKLKDDPTADTFERDFYAALVESRDDLPLTQHLYPHLAPSVAEVKAEPPKDQKEVNVNPYALLPDKSLFTRSQVGGSAFLGTPEPAPILDKRQKQERSSLQLGGSNVD